MALSDVYHDIAYGFLDKAQHYLNEEVYGHSSEDKRRVEQIFQLLMNECSLLDLNLDGIIGDPNEMIEFQKRLKDKDAELVKEQNEILESLKIKFS